MAKILRNLDKEKIFEILRKNKKKLRKLQVKKIGLFGSFLKGYGTIESDVDFLVEFNDGEKNFNNYIELAFLLEELMERKIDLLTKEALNPHMKSRILEEAYFETI